MHLAISQVHEEVLAFWKHSVIPLQ